MVAGATDKSSVQTTQTDHTALLQQAGVAAFTLGGESGQQVYVITDPTQLEALQVIVHNITAYKFVDKVKYLTHCSRETLKRVISKQCRSRTDTAESGI